MTGTLNCLNRGYEGLNENRVFEQRPEVPKVLLERNGSGKESKMEIATRLSNEISQYLDLTTRQIQVTSANMANIDTPGYKTTGMNFEAEMQTAMAGVSSGAASRDPRIFDVDGLVVRPDGNNVSMDREGLNLAEAQLKFKTGVALLKREYTRILDAIHADAK